MIFLLGMLLSSCNYTKHLTKDQTLIGKTSLKLNTLKKIKYKGEFESAKNYIQKTLSTYLLDIESIMIAKGQRPDEEGQLLFNNIKYAACGAEMVFKK